MHLYLWTLEMNNSIDNIHKYNTISFSNKQVRQTNREKRDLKNNITINDKYLCEVPPRTEKHQDW